VRNALAALLIVGLTAAALYAIAVHKNEALAGPGAFRLDGAHPEELRVFEDLLTQLTACDPTDVAGRMRAASARGVVWIAPNLDPGRRAVYVNSLNLVRVYIARRELMEPSERLFPQMHVPEANLRTFAFVTFAGTLEHELAHYGGIEDEGAAYATEIAWYRMLRRSDYRARMTPEDRSVYDWAIDLAIGNAEHAKTLAGAD
jgi:hypothetical protein